MSPTGKSIVVFASICAGFAALFWVTFFVRLSVVGCLAAIPIWAFFKFRGKALSVVHGVFAGAVPAIAFWIFLTSQESHEGANLVVSSLVLFFLTVIPAAIATSIAAGAAN